MGGKRIDRIRVSDDVGVNLIKKRWENVGAPPIFKPGPVSVECNVRLQLKDKSGRVEEEREGNNIFVDYGREWLSELIALQSLSPDTAFRSDRVRYMAFGIGGTAQSIATADINTMQPGAHPKWGTAFDGVGGADPVQTDSDPTVTGLEWPVIIREPTPGVADYYDDVSAPATFPDTGVVRFTAVLGYDEVSYIGTLGSFSQVPVSEVGLFTESVSAQTVVPWNATHAPAGERFMVAYNTFASLIKTPSFVLQTDWEIRVS
jgi:hypothetical protein